MEFYSAIRKNEILSFAGKWKELESIILSEVSQVQKFKCYMFSLICEYKLTTNASNIIYTHKYIQHMYPKVGLLEETKGGGKEGKKDGEQ
jgi:hypothetical protein